MARTTRSPVRRQSPAAPMPPHDGLSPAELRTRRVLDRFSFSREVAVQIAAMAYAVPEHRERRA